MAWHRTYKNCECKHRPEDHAGPGACSKCRCPIFRSRMAPLVRIAKELRVVKEFPHECGIMVVVDLQLKCGHIVQRSRGGESARCTECRDKRNAKLLLGATRRNNVIDLPLKRPQVKAGGNKCPEEGAISLNHFRSQCTGVHGGTAPIT